MLLPLALLATLCSPAPQDPAPKPEKPKREAKAPKEVPKADKEEELKKKALAGKAVPAKEIESAIQRGIVLLLAQQESLDPAIKTKAEWPYEGVYRFRADPKSEAVIPIGYRVGGTAIACVALIEATDAKPKDDVRAALERALDFVLASLDQPLMDDGFEQGYDVRGWGHAYALQFLLRLREAALVPEKKRATVEQGIDWLVDMLAKTAIEKPGGWNYSRRNNPKEASPSTFMTAPTLQILFEAARAGEKVDAAVVEKALATLESARLDTGAFQYGTDPARKTGKGFEDVPGAIGRSPNCEVTLFLAGRGSVERIRTSLEQFFEHWQWLEVRRKHDQTHIPPYMIAPYYYFYAHRYAAQAIELLPEAERAGWREKLDKLLWAVREEDGGWNDRVFKRSENFGTAMTLLALKSPALRPPATWDPKQTK